jgi:hypothetical protein
MPVKRRKLQQIVANGAMDSRTSDQAKCRYLTLERKSRQPEWRRPPELRSMPSARHVMRGGLSESARMSCNSKSIKKSTASSETRARTTARYTHVATNVVHITQIPCI